MVRELDGNDAIGGKTRDVPLIVKVYEMKG